jgi:hypothetical protein
MGNKVAIFVVHAAAVLPVVRACHFKSEIPKSQIESRRRVAQTVRSEISDFGFEMQDLPDFEIAPPLPTL